MFATQVQEPIWKGGHGVTMAAMEKACEFDRAQVLSLLRWLTTVWNTTQYPRR